MEAIAGSSSKVLTVDDNVRALKEQITDIGDNELPSSITAVVSNADLLIEILHRLSILPTISLLSDVRLAFDPTKSPYYKVIQSVLLDQVDHSENFVRIETYSFRNRELDCLC
ncbi:hypothetical protein Tco_0218420 [Tanacetum coccineum]